MDPALPVVYRNRRPLAMTARTPRTPSYRLHRPSGQAVVTLGGHDHYLGRHGSPESRAEYDRLVAEWLAAGRTAPPAGAAPSDLTVNELVLRYARHVEGYYVKDGKPTSEVRNIKLALRPLRRLYGPTPARGFGPKGLKAVRAELVAAGLCRNEVNKRVRHVVRLFKWAVAEEIVAPAVHQALAAVPGLRKGRGGARESAPVRPAPEADVEAVRPHVGPRVWAMIELQRLTGMRPGEVVRMRGRDVQRDGRVWAYVPESHKTEHHGKGRTVYLGPKAQEVLRPWLKADPDAYLFSPREAVEDALRLRSESRKTPRRPPHPTRARRGYRRLAPGERYTAESYPKAVARACERAGVPHWHPHRLRHNAATRLRREFGLEVARVILGHSSPATTESYAEIDRRAAVDAMERAG
jgi:integrase